MIFFIKIILIFIWFAICTVFCALFVIPFYYKNPNGVWVFAKIFSKGALFISGVSVEVRGKENIDHSRIHVYVANHQSGFDIPAFAPAYEKNTFVIAKQELSKIPIFGWFFVATGNIFINRQKRAHSVQGLSQAIQVMKSFHRSVWFFPEGTRNPTGKGILPLKKGAFHVAIEAQALVTPIICSPMLPIVDWKAKKLRRGKLQIQILPSVDTKGMLLSQLDGLVATVQQNMESGLLEVQTKIY